MVSVIIAAHNEEAVIDRCLTALLAQDVPGRLEIIVSANGCADRTAEVAARRGAVVIDRPEPGKAAALNAAEDVAGSFPRIYLDADIVVPPGGLTALCEALDAPGILAAVPARRIEVVGRSWPVRAYTAISSRLPVFRRGLFGRGLIALSEEGRDRFADFPTLVADDLFLDSLFDDAEKREVAAIEVVVEAPMRTSDLLARLIRVRRGNAQLRAAAASGEVAITVRPSDRWAWLRDVVVPNPWLAPAAVPYVVITAIAGRRGRRGQAVGWGHDTSTRARPEENVT